jgi:hypothetical protein
MSIVHLLAIWMLAIGFVGAGLVNVMNRQASREGFVRWGYPSWWGRLTGGLEIMSAALIAIPSSRGAGLLLGGVIILAAVATLLRHRHYAHLPPALLFLATIAMAVMTTTPGSP